MASKVGFDGARSTRVFRLWTRGIRATSCAGGTPQKQGGDGGYEHQTYFPRVSVEQLIEQALENEFLEESRPSSSVEARDDAASTSFERRGIEFPVRGRRKDERRLKQYRDAKAEDESSSSHPYRPGVLLIHGPRGSGKRSIVQSK